MSQSAVEVTDLDAMFDDGDEITAADRARYAAELNASFPHLAGIIARTPARRSA